ncbi:MAG: hypothetical protein M3313_02310 [Actinomycetota bacterium]|nr:hypothetical protein [Actinomycetota bacterium]
MTDDVVYLSDQLIERDRDLFGVDMGLAIAFIVAEEFGLALQEVRGEPGIDIPDLVQSRQFVLTADCLAGTWAASEQTAGRLSVEALRSVIHEQLTAGYVVPVPLTMSAFLRDQAHGSFRTASRL